MNDLSALRHTQIARIDAIMETIILQYDLRLINAQIAVIDEIKALNRSIMETITLQLERQEDEERIQFLQGKWSGLKAAQHNLGVRRFDLLKQRKLLETQ